MDEQSNPNQPSLTGVRPSWRTPLVPHRISPDAIVGYCDQFMTYRSMVLMDAVNAAHRLRHALAALEKDAYTPQYLDALENVAKRLNLLAEVCSPRPASGQGVPLQAGRYDSGFFSHAWSEALLHEPSAMARMTFEQKVEYVKHVEPSQAAFTAMGEAVQEQYGYVHDMLESLREDIARAKECRTFVDKLPDQGRAWSMRIRSELRLILHQCDTLEADYVKQAAPFDRMVAAQKAVQAQQVTR